MTNKIPTESYNSITKINNLIYLGPYEYPFESSPEFNALKIDVIFNCAKEIRHPNIHSYDIKYYPIIENDPMSFLENFDKIIEQMHKYLCKGKKIYLHSAKSISRAPAILVYYLMQYKKLTYDKAVNLLSKKRPSIDICEDIESQLRLIEEY
jgi:protein-tyrosine phosphatase